MGRHESPKSLWPSLLGIIGVALILTALILFLIWNPQWMPKG